MPFHLGSLGFLTPFNFDTYQSQVTQVIEGECPGLAWNLSLFCLKERLTGIDVVSPIFRHFASLFCFSIQEVIALSQILSHQPGPDMFTFNMFMLQWPFLTCITHVL